MKLSPAPTYYKKILGGYVAFYINNQSTSIKVKRDENAVSGDNMKASYFAFE